MPGAAVPFTIEVGHGSFRERWGADAGHLMALREITTGGVVNLKPLFRAGGKVPHLVQTFRRPGAHIVAMSSTPVLSDLPAIRFNDYAKVEGLTQVLATREANGTTAANGRELYSRRAKALIQLGPVRAADTALVTRPIGLSLEIVPLRNPYALGSDRSLPVQVLFGGRPLAGALVKLTNLEFDARPIATIRSDAQGKAVFQVPPTGSWLINVIWATPVRLRGADFETTFSSMTFGYQGSRRS